MTAPKLERLPVFILTDKMVFGSLEMLLYDWHPNHVQMKWNQRSLRGRDSGYWTTFKGVRKQQGIGTEMNARVEVEKITNTVAQEGIENRK